MKITKRISVSLLVLIMVLSAVLAIPASAGLVEEHHEFGRCSCQNVDFEAIYASDIVTNGISRAVTHLYHPSNQCDAATVYVSAKFWVYPTSGSSTYRTVVRTDTEYGTNVDASVNSYGISGEVFCIESNHTITTRCNNTNYTYSKYISNGEPAMK